MCISKYTTAYAVLSCLYILVSPALGLSCIDKCNLAFGSLPRADICGSDGKSYSAPLVAIVGLAPPLFTCYRTCDIDVLYPGKCGCPNACNSIAGKGKCSNETCECEEGWGGIDCSSVICPKNKCSDHGKCVSINKHIDACACDDGYTGDDCSLKTLDISSLPYGELLPSSDYYHNDDYEDNHPVFDPTRIANIHITLDSHEAFEDIFKPVNTWNQSYTPGSFTFSNGKIQGKHHKVALKLKGHLARIASKKSFIMKFEDDDNDDKKNTKNLQKEKGKEKGKGKGDDDQSFFGLKHLVFKAPSLDPSYLHNQIVGEFYRAMGVPAVRTSFATLTINGVYYGLYSMYEEIDKDFIKSRYGNKDGNLYMLSTYLRDIGSDPKAYEDLTIKNVGRTLNAYTEEFGDGNFEDLAELAQFTNKSASTFEAGIEDIFNVDNFLRSLVVISAIDNGDSSPRDGNNWALYNSPAKDDRKVWQYIPKDHEFTFINPFGGASESITKSDALTHHVLKIQKHHDLFNKYYATFLQNIYNPSIKNNAQNRIDSFEPLLTDIIKGDYSYHISYGIPMGEFTWQLCVQDTKKFIDLRYQFLSRQLTTIHKLN